jgi:ABC-type transporter Mla subunit MlaD
MPTSEERLNRFEQRQEVIISTMSSMVETMATISDMIAELGQWLRQPASSDLPDLLTTLIQRSETISDQMVLVGGKMDALPAAVARAVVNGEVA